MVCDGSGDLLMAKMMLRMMFKDMVKQKKQLVTVYEGSSSINCG